MAASRGCKVLEEWHYGLDARVERKCVRGVEYLGCLGVDLPVQGEERGNRVAQVCGIWREDNAVGCWGGAG